MPLYSFRLVKTIPEAHGWNPNKSAGSIASLGMGRLIRWILVRRARSAAAAASVSHAGGEGGYRGESRRPFVECIEFACAGLGWRCLVESTIAQRTGGWSANWRTAS
jgi:hypothetical protein